MQVVEDVATDYWRTGRAPPDMPSCGFDGGLCDYTNVYLILIASGVAVAIIICGIIVYRYRYATKYFRADQPR